MFKQALIFLPLLFGSPAALAMTCASEISATRGESRVGEATCKNCSSVNDFARFGASVLYDNHQAAIKNVGYPRFNRVLVKSGSRAVTVTIDSVLLDTPVSLGEFGINYGIRQQHRGVVAVNATPYRGEVVGSPWTGAQVQISELIKLCKAIKIEKEMLTNPPLSNAIESSPQYQLYKETNAYNKWHSFGQQQAQRWQRQRDWEYISRVQRNSLSGPQGCYGTPTGVACFRNTRNFNYY